LAIRAFVRAAAWNMTHSMTLEVRTGTMIIFPGQLVHFVNPYTGRSPRITLARNFTTRALAGHARDDWQ
jgi:gentisate 1,2-dioxygenase